jgi:hypothetical protein
MPYNNLLLQLLGNIGKKPNVTEGSFDVDPTSGNITVKPATINRKLGAILTGENLDVADNNRAMIAAAAKLNAERAAQLGRQKHDIALKGKPGEDQKEIQNNAAFIAWASGQRLPPNDNARKLYNAQVPSEQQVKLIQDVATTGLQADVAGNRAIFSRANTNIDTDKVTIKGNQSTKLQHQLGKIFLTNALKQVQDDENLRNSLTNSAIFGDIVKKGFVNVGQNETVADFSNPLSPKGLFMGATPRQEVSLDLMQQPTSIKTGTNPGYPMRIDPSIGLRAPKPGEGQQQDDGASTDTNVTTKPYAGGINHIFDDTIQSEIWKRIMAAAAQKSAFTPQEDWTNARVTVR